MRNTMRWAALLLWLAGFAGCAAPAAPAPATNALQAAPPQATAILAGAPAAIPTPTVPSPSPAPAAKAPLVTPLAAAPAPATTAGVAGAASAAALVSGGAPWLLAQWQDAGGATVAIPSPQQYRVQFQADGTVSVRTDCASSRGTYTINGQNLTIKLEAMTGAMCAPDSPADAFVTGIGTATSYSFDGTTMILHPAGGGSLRFNH